MYMDDIKLFAKNEKELETLIQAVRMYSQDIGTKFGIEKCTRLTLSSGKRQMTKGIELPNQEKIRTLGEKEIYKYLEILEANTIKQVHMKGKKNFFKYLRRTRKLLETKLYNRNFIKGINNWPVPLLRYSRQVLKLTREEFKEIDQRTRKPMKMYKALHAWDDIDRLYVSRKEGGKGLARIQDNVDTTTRPQHEKEKRKTDNSDQKQHKQQNDQ